ncbi:hypothetical protein F4776DRAFT_598722 [Hypoxylon sp. NC0597]|nr:hypothetical protein F4776DRAFT_598722 [Hypoxylon sp. NC0597]
MAPIRNREKDIPPRQGNVFAFDILEPATKNRDQLLRRAPPPLFNDPKAYFRPHLYLTVRIGPSGEELPIFGVIDTGAEATILALSYARAHNLPMRRSKLTWSGFGKGSSVPCAGVIEGPIWLAGQSLRLPIYVQVDFSLRNGRRSYRDYELWICNDRSSLNPSDCH